MSDSEDTKILAEELIDFCNALESIAVKLRVQIEKMLGIAKVEKPKPKVVLSEKTFNILKWQVEKGNRLGEYEVAYKNQNILDSWQHCFNILKQNSAVIGNRFHEEGYGYAYWIYPEKYEDRIFRKKLNEVKG
jgi:hypothetical protein